MSDEKPKPKPPAPPRPETTSVKGTPKGTPPKDTPVKGK